MTTPDALPPLSDEQRERIRARLMAEIRERNKGMSDERSTKDKLPASLAELARIAKQYSLDTARWHQTSRSWEYMLYTRGDGGERFNFTAINEDQAYALGMILQAFPVLLEMAREVQPDEHMTKYDALDTDTPLPDGSQER